MLSGFAGDFRTTLAYGNKPMRCRPDRVARKNRARLDLDQVPTPGAGLNCPMSETAATPAAMEQDAA
jgi:hypothetical protein